MDSRDCYSGNASDSMYTIINTLQDVGNVCSHLESAHSRFSAEGVAPMVTALSSACLSQ